MEEFTALSYLKTTSRSLYVKNGVAITLKKQCGEVCYSPPKGRATRLLCLPLEKQKYQEDTLLCSAGTEQLSDELSISNTWKTKLI